MTTTSPEIQKPAVPEEVSNAANEKLVLGADVQRQLKILATRLPQPESAADQAEQGQSLTATTRSLLEKGRTPQQVAAATLQRGYPQAA